MKKTNLTSFGLGAWIVGCLGLSPASGAPADLNGSWSGPVYFSDSDGYSIQCQSMTVSFSTSSYRFHFTQDADCGDFTVHMDAVIDRDGSELKVEKKVIGAISGDSVTFDGFIPQPNLRYSLTARVNSQGALEFRDQMLYGAKPPQFSDSLQGILVKGTKSLTRKAIKP